MRLIDADVLIGNIQCTRQEIRKDCENNDESGRAARVLLYLMDMLEDAVQEMPVININIHDGGDTK